VKKAQIRKQQRQALMLIVFGGLLVIVAAFLIGRQKPGPVISTAPQETEGLPNPEVSRIPLETARARFDAGTVIIIDVRSQAEYETSHIPGAVSMPLAEVQIRFQELPPGSEILTYCT
jgi:3-mercaptopyruvate sulfurtransferase SseA